MLRLLYNIGGDMNPLKKVLGQIPEEAKKAGKESGSQLGKEMGAQAKGVLMSMIGGGAIVALFRKEMENAKVIAKESGRTGLGSKEVQTLQRISERTGLSPDDILARGKANPKAFETLVRAAESEGGFQSEGQVKANVERAGAFSRFGRAVGGGVSMFGEAVVGGTIAAAGTTAAMVAEKMQPGENQQRMIRAGKMLDLEAQRIAERMVGVGKDPESSKVEEAIRALHRTVEEKL